MDVDKKAPASIDSFQECIYSWELLEDPFAAATPEQTEEIRKIFSNFAPDKSPHERELQVLKGCIQTFDEVLKTSDNFSWSESQSFIRLQDGDVINFRQHRLLALRQHLQWIYDSFGDVPGANLTLR